MAIRLSDRTVRREFIEKVKELSGQNIYQCFQCGTCTASCPMAGELAVVPRRLMRMAQMGMAEAVEACDTFWTCASCHSCSVNCPRGVDLARVMEALRLLVLRRNVDYVKLSELSEEDLGELPQIALVSGFRKLTS